MGFALSDMQLRSAAFSPSGVISWCAGQNAFIKQWQIDPADQHLFEVNHCCYRPSRFAVRHSLREVMLDRGIQFWSASV